MELSYQTVTEGDFETLVLMRITAMRESLERVGRFDPERARERLRQTFAPEHTRLILKVKDQVGFYTFRPTPDGFHLDHLYVLPEFQSQGIGAAVMKYLVAEADEKEMPVLVGALKESASNQFYQRHGFVKARESEWDVYYVRSPKLGSSQSSV